ncbi:hypothetical protein [Jeotgalibaca ciconiae]|uniref:Endolytic transglycosylase MltG n=1 Tax=Jeotgalibaca ciconiae TaxID=2496265 RepID=A0A3Q9BN38_9LACT|nr:hypothetical protein [Jeotgalibaca ciconiae]AZP05256.1 hypothetical protein EJN90_11730 [Jeotgalibaca ciconiae]HJB22992.1 hypothetical protein [Candidatus Jeotgalibaca pullicola]
MTKDRLRFLALGFFFSALLLSAYNLFASPVAAQKEGSEETDTSNMVDYQNKYEELLVEHELLKKEMQSKHSETTLSEESSDNEELESVNEETESTTSESEAAEDDLQSDNQIVFLIHEGQPSSVVLQNLVEAGLIDSVEDAENYLQDNDLTSKLQYGSYDLSKDMTQEQILDTITME